MLRPSKNHRYVIAGCSRDNKQYLPFVFQNIARIISHVDVVSVIVCYEKEDVDTKQALDDQVCLVPVLAIARQDMSELNLTSKATREERLADARNVLLRFLEHHYADSVDHVIMMDMDDVCSEPMDTTVLVQALREGEREKMDAITFDNERYYDFYALVFPHFDYGLDCWGFRDRSVNEKIQAFVLAHLLQCRKMPSTFIPVRSAFNGFAIYKLESIRGYRYHSIIPTSFYNASIVEFIETHFETQALHFWDTQMRRDCEHKYFHFQLEQSGFKMGIYNKGMLFPPYHGIHANWLYN